MQRADDTLRLCWCTEKQHSMLHWASNYTTVGQCSTISANVTEMQMEASVNTEAKKTNNQALFSSTILKANMAKFGGGPVALRGCKRDFYPLGKCYEDGLSGTGSRQNEMRMGGQALAVGSSTSVGGPCAGPLTTPRRLRHRYDECAPSLQNLQSLHLTHLMHTL